MLVVITAVLGALFSEIWTRAFCTALQQMMKDICRSWTNLTGQPADQLLVNLRETDASMAMEAGIILPQPGQEAEWFNEHRAQLGHLAPEGVQAL